MNSIEFSALAKFQTGAILEKGEEPWDGCQGSMRMSLVSVVAKQRK